MIFRGWAIAALLAHTLLLPGFAQMTADQKAGDLTQLAATFAKNYGPLQWKRDSIHFDLLDIGKWVERARTTPSDLDFYDVCVQYVASLKDAHSGFYLPSDFVAALPFKVDLYDGKAMVDGLWGALEGVDNFPITIGDEILSIDGAPISDLIDGYLRYAVTGNAKASRRLAAAYVFDRAQQLIPRAHETPDSAQITVRHSDGSIATVTALWMKSGTPLTTVGPVISPSTSRHAAEASYGRKSMAAASYLTPLERLRQMRVPAVKLVTGFGSVHPVFYFAPGFQVRSGDRRSDVYYSGSYQQDGLRIGYLRIPSFDLIDLIPVLQEEIAWMQQNTDGLVIDIMRNPGGDACFAQELLRLLIPYPFHMAGLQIRATRTWLRDFQAALVQAAGSGASPDIVQQYQAIVQQVQDAYMTPSGTTGPLPVCGPPSN